MKRLALALPLVLALAGCGILAPTIELEGRTFVSIGVTDGDAPRPLAPNTQISLEFGPDGQLGIHAGCNRMGGTWRLTDGRLEVEQVFTTDMACEPPRMDQDEWVASFLGADPELALSGAELALSSGSVRIHLVDQAVAEPALPLVGPVWTVESVISGDAVGNIPGVVATLQFAEDGTVTIDNGCNQGGGSVREGEPGTLVFGEVMTTLIGCEADAAAMEGAVMAVVGGGPVRWSIEGDRLTLTAGANGLILRAP